MSQTHLELDHESPPNTPRWVKVFGIVVVVLILFVVTLYLTGHGPMNHGDHMPSTHQGEHQP